MVGVGLNYFPVECQKHDQVMRTHRKCLLLTLTWAKCTVDQAAQATIKSFHTHAMGSISK